MEISAAWHLGKALILFVLSPCSRMQKFDVDHVMKKNNIFCCCLSPFINLEGYILAKTPADFTH
ncbi:hypothetical protein DBY68_012695 [Pseudocitrobacter sp. RIT415]|nr:hypothetical protein DBY68_012695 [Pseudocitrobacter sp. RIT 415]